MNNYVSPLIFFVLLVVGAPVAAWIGVDTPEGALFVVAWFLGDLLVASAVWRPNGNAR